MRTWLLISIYLEVFIYCLVPRSTFLLSLGQVQFDQPSPPTFWHHRFWAISGSQALISGGSAVSNLRSTHYCGKPPSARFSISPFCHFSRFPLSPLFRFSLSDLLHFCLLRLSPHKILRRHYNDIASEIVSDRWAMQDLPVLPKRQHLVSRKQCATFRSAYVPVRHVLFSSHICLHFCFGYIIDRCCFLFYFFFGSYSVLLSSFASLISCSVL